MSLLLIKAFISLIFIINAIIEMLFNKFKSTNEDSSTSSKDSLQTKRGVNSPDQDRSEV